MTIIGLKYHLTVIWLIGIIHFPLDSAFDINDVKFDVFCNYTGIYAVVETRTAYKGTVYAHSSFFNPNCRFDSPTIGVKSFVFLIPLKECGNILQHVDNTIFVSNTIVMQKHHIVETDSDLIQNITCQVSIPDYIDDDDFPHESHPIHYRNKEIEAWMEFEIGGNILGTDIPNKLLVGDEFKMVIHLKGGEEYKYLQVDRCWAYDGETIADSRYILEVFNIYSCQKSDWIPGFNLTTGTNNVSDYLAYSVMKAFKFTLSKNLYFTCSIQACKKGCFTFCDVPGSNDYPGRLKKSGRRSGAKRSFVKRRRMLKSTIKTLAVRLRENNRAGLSENDSNFLKRSSDSRNASLKNYVSTVNLIKSGKESTNEITWNSMFYFNLTNNVVVLTDREFSYKPYHRHDLKINISSDYISKTKFGFVTATLAFLIFFLILTCIGLTLYIRKENKKMNIPGNFMLFDFQ